MASLNRNLSYNFLLSGTQLLIPLISIPYLSRILDPEGLGKVSFIDSFTYYFISIAEFGVAVYGVREVSRLRDNIIERRKLVSELLALHVITSLCSLLLYCFAVYFLWNKIGDTRLLFFSLSFLIINFFACEWYFLGMEEFRYITFRSLLTRLGGLVSIFILVKEPSDYYIYYGIIATSAIAIGIWNNVLLFRELRISFKGVNWRKHIKYTKITYLISLVYSISLLLDTFFLRMVSTASAVGIYALSIKMVTIPTTLLTDTLLVFFPRIVIQLKKGDRSTFQEMILNNIQIITLIAIPGCAGILLLAEPLITVFLGANFLQAIPNLKILALFPFIKAYSLFLSKQVLIANNKERLYLNSLIISNTVFICLTLFLSYNYQDTGACYAILLTEIIGLAINYYYAKATIPYLKVFDWKALFQSGAGCLLFVPVIYLINMIKMPLVASLVLSIIICGIVYILFLTFVAGNDILIGLKSRITNK